MNFDLKKTVIPRMGEKKSKQIFLILSIFITAKYLESTNHDPFLNLTVNCKNETFHSLSQRKKIQ